MFSDESHERLEKKLQPRSYYSIPLFGIFTDYRARLESPPLCQLSQPHNEPRNHFINFEPNRKILRETVDKTSLWTGASLEYLGGAS
jgi:hypothetical protein